MGGGGGEGWGDMSAFFGYQFTDRLSFAAGKQQITGDIS